METYHSHHAPTGGRASFLAGLDKAPSGFVGADGTPGNQGVFVGIRQASDLPWRMLPQFSEAPTPATGANEPFEILSPGRYGRTFALASDRWLIGPLVFKLCTPFWKTDDPANADRETARLHFAPSVGGFVEYDNTHSDEPVEVLVGFGGTGFAFRKLEGDAAGFTSDGRIGFATLATDEVRTRLGDSPFVEANAASGAGKFAALVFTVPAKVKRVFPVALGFFNPGDTILLYHSVFSGIAEVLTHALANHEAVVSQANALDAEWFGSALTREQKLAHSLAVRGYLAATAMRKASGGWVLDADHGPAPSEAAAQVAFAFEAEFHPWSVRNRLAAEKSG